MSEDIRKWSDGRYTLMFDEHTFFVFDNENEERMTALNVTKKLNELAEKNEQLRFELETHKHPLWSTREAERKVNELGDSLADEIKKNGLLNEEINQLRIENMRLKKKGGNNDMTKKRFGYGETDLFEWVEYNGKMISTKECVKKLNEQHDELQLLRATNREQYEQIQRLLKEVGE